jgi:hypothetical protein
MIRPGIYKTFCATSRGYGFGIFDENNDFIRMNTFITNEMLKAGQMTLAEQLNKKMEKYLNDPMEF